MNANSAQFAASNDLDLVHASKKGDAAAFEQLVKRYDHRLLRIAQTVTRNRGEFRRRGSESAVESLSESGRLPRRFPILNLADSHYCEPVADEAAKTAHPQRGFVDEDFDSDGDVLPLDVPDRAPNPEHLCWASELRDILVRTVEELRPILRTVFVLRDVEGLSIEQTAQVLNLNQTAVKARLWRVRLHLRERLNRYSDKRMSLASEELAPTSRATKKIIGLLAECLRDSIPRTYSTSIAQ
jgi:RNA polymerase sigma-70 factor, ECF subfamily